MLPWPVGMTGLELPLPSLPKNASPLSMAPEPKIDLPWPELPHS